MRFQKSQMDAASTEASGQDVGLWLWIGSTNEKIAFVTRDARNTV